MKWFKVKEKKYYREFMQCCGWGVMLGFDTVYATSANKAWCMPVRQGYGDRPMDGVYRVKDKDLDKTDVELSRIYGKQD